MRLLQREKSGWLNRGYQFSLTKCDPRGASYAILSHRWGTDEVEFKEVESGTVKTKAGGFKKLNFCAEQAARDGLTYCWVDTCCIDKTSSAELSEAINSMFKWYQMATKCYVYLTDVSAEGEWEFCFQQSEWFRRGWTLQELLAPAIVEFFSKEGTKLGDKRSLERQIHQATGISIEALRGKPLSEIDQEERMAWTARRETTVDEDSAYCLLGIFDVHMPLIYGEGRQKALARLQLEIQHSAKSSAFVVRNTPWIVPFERNSRFTGRESLLADLQKRMFVKNQNHTSKIAITGLGGVGKTQLVLELLYITKEQHPDSSIMWIPSTTTENLQQGYLAVAQQLNIPGCDDEKADVKKLVQDYLSKDDTGQWLLVFDNADDIAMWTSSPSTGEYDGSNIIISGSSSTSRRLIDYLPRNRQGCIIFTTRDRRAAIQLAQQNIITVPEMSDEMATQLLKKSLITPNIVDDPHDVLNLVSALTHLPLAITQAAAYINATGISLADYVSLLEEKEDDAVEVLSENFEDFGRYRETKNPIATTWLIYFEQIRRSDSLAAEYLSFMACINPRNIPQSLLPPGPSRKKEIDAVGTLMAYSFITRRPVSSSFDLHRLVHLTMRNWLRKEDLLSQQIEASIFRLEEVFPTDDHNNRAIWRLYLPHAQQVLASHLVDEEGKQRVKLMWRCGNCLMEDARWAEAEVLYKEVLAIYMKTLGAEHRHTLAGQENVALTYRKQGRWEEAEQVLLQVMEARKTIQGADHPDTLKVMHNLAATYHRRGRLKEAEQLEVQVLEVSKTRHVMSYLDTLTCMNNLAMTYWKQGRLEEAEQLEVQVMEARKTTLGVDHLETLVSMQNLAVTYTTQGRIEEAEQLEVQVLEKNKMKLDGDHPGMLTSMQNLACTWKSLQRDTEAILLMEDCVQRRARVQGTTHPDYLESREALEIWKAEHAEKERESATQEDVI